MIVFLFYITMDFLLILRLSCNLCSFMKCKFVHAINLFSYHSYAYLIRFGNMCMYMYILYML